MTEAVFCWGPDALTLRADGHATGRPDVCAAASGLLYALECWAAVQARENRWAPGRWEARVGKGVSRVRLPRTAETESAFGLVWYGLGMIAAAAPEAMQVHTEDPAGEGPAGEGAKGKE